MQTYALKQVVLDGKRGEHLKSHYITVAEGLSFAEAKRQRNQRRSLSIVPERLRQG
jgi:hypothetical protein